MPSEEYDMFKMFDEENIEDEDDDDDDSESPQEYVNTYLSDTKHSSFQFEFEVCSTKTIPHWWFILQFT